MPLPARPPPWARGPASAFRGWGGGAFLFLPLLPSPLPQPRRPGSPAAHVAILSWGVGDASKVLSGAGSRARLALASRPPGPRTALLPAVKTRPALNLHPGGLPLARKPREEKRAAARSPPFAPELPLLPAPILSGSMANSAPGRTLRAGPGFPVGSGPWVSHRRARVVGCDLAVRLSSRGGGLCLCALGICLGGLQMLTLVCTCRFCFVLLCFNLLEKLV